jgi:type IV pilus assembly protein PilC
MPVFAYTAIDRQGRKRTGTVPGSSRAAAMDEVVASGLTPIAFDEQAADAEAKAPVETPTTRVPASAVESFTRELANLLGAGIPLSKGLSLLQREASHASARKVWTAVHDDVVGGSSLADALARWPRTFSSVYIAMVQAGEAGGFLHLVLQQIADFRSREQDLKGRVTAALIYPAVLAFLACGVVVFLLTFFIPRFSGIFAEFGGRLPWLTQMIVGASQGLTRYGIYLLALAIAGGVALRRLATTPEGRRFVERTVLRIPMVGRLVARFALVRFCRMLGTLIGSGVPLVAALRVAKESLGNQTLADTVVEAIEMVERGSSLAKGLASSPILFPVSVIEMVTVAEETGRLDKELIRLSGVYEGDLDRRLRMFIALAEPALLFVMASIIGTVVVGMLLPVFELQELVH